MCLRREFGEQTRTFLPALYGAARRLMSGPAEAEAVVMELYCRAAHAQGLQFRIHHAETSQWFSSLRMGETTSGFKVVIEEGSQRILGAHLFGPHAEA